MTLLPRTTPTAILPASPDAMDIAKDEAENVSLPNPSTLSTIRPQIKITTLTHHNQPSQQILLTSLTGTISLLTPLTEPQYRRLSTLTNHLTNTLSQPCGLNPKAYRISEKAGAEGLLGGGLSGGVGVGGAGRAIVDGKLVLRWLELGSQRRAEVAGRVGIAVEELRDELEEVGGGLGYL